MPRNIAAPSSEIGRCRVTNSVRAGSLCAVALLALASQAAAQRDTLVAGSWHGVIAPEGEAAYKVTWVITHTKKGPQIELRIPNGPTTLMGGVKQKGSRLTFTWAAGGPRPFFCTLYRDGDGSYGGKCDDPVIGPTGEYVSAQVTMLPPGMRRAASP